MVPKMGKNLEGYRTDPKTVKISEKFRPGPRKLIIGRNVMGTIYIYIGM